MAPEAKIPNVGAGGKCAARPELVPLTQRLKEIVKGATTSVRRHWSDWLVLTLGAWLSLSPLTFGYPQASAALNAQLTGVALILFALLSILQFRAWETWSSFVLGAWLTSAPTVLRYDHVPILAWNSIIIGAIVVVCALTVFTRANVVRPRFTNRRLFIK